MVRIKEVYNRNISNKISFPKVVSSTKEENDDKEQKEDYVLNISQNGRKHLKQYQETNTNIKKRGDISARELWEDNIYAEKEGRFFHDDGTLDFFELFRSEAPEMYAQYRDYNERFTASMLKDGIEVAIRDIYDPELATLSFRWMSQKLSENPNYFLNPQSKKDGVISYLDQAFSDNLHNVSFDFYSEKFDNNFDIWRFSAKYCVQLTESIYQKLTSGDVEEKKDILNIISKHVDEMKNADKMYEGNKSALRYGVKFRNDLSVTYCAKYGGGAYHMNNINAKSIEDLIRALED